MSQEWHVVGAKNKKVRPTLEHKELENKHNVRGLANTLASPAAANLEKQGFKFYTVEKAPETPPQDKSDDMADYTYLPIKDNRYGDYAGFMRWKEDKPDERRGHMFVMQDDGYHHNGQFVPKKMVLEHDAGFYSVYGPGVYSDGKFYNLQGQCEDDDDQ